jgi:hypothetical protein
MAMRIASALHRKRIGGFEVIEREHKVLLEKGPSRISPTSYRPLS